MLVILYGTSCSGKSEIIRRLVFDYDFKIIMCYHTRQSRENDLARTAISNEQFDNWISEGILGFINEQLDARYANKIGDFENAIKSDDKYVLDWPLSKRKKLERYKHHKIIILPENKEQLVHQIGKAKRLGRKDEILKDYENNYSPEKIDILLSKGFQVVINKLENIDFATQEILKITSNGNI